MKITSLTTHDVRFPTARPPTAPTPSTAADYSAAYVELRTDARGVTGPGSPSPTAGATRSPRGHRGAGAARRRPYARGHHRRPARSGARSRPTASSAGSDRRRASSTWRRRARQRRVGSAGQARGQAAVAAAGPTCRRTSSSPRRLPPHHRRAHPGRGPRPAGERRPGSTSELELLERGFPAYTTSVGWLGYADEKVRALVRAGGRRRLPPREDEGRRDLDDDVRRAALIRDEIGADGVLMMDANQVWDVDEAIAAMRRLAEFDPCWIEEPTHADDVLGHARIRRAIAPDPGRDRRGCPEPGHLQAAAAGGRDRRLPDRRLPGRRRQRGPRDLLMAAKFGVPVCPHAGGVGLCEYVQHLAIFDYLAVSGIAGRADGGVRRPSARALRRPGGRGTAATACRRRPATASRCAGVARGVRVPGRTGLVAPRGSGGVVVELTRTVELPETRTRGAPPTRTSACCSWGCWCSGQARP